MAVPEGIITTSDILVSEEVEEVTAPAEVEEVTEEVETDAEV
jgi:hypothetical protein